LNSVESFYSALTPDERERLTERAGKYMEDGLDAVQADLKALGEIIGKAGGEQKDAFRFTRVGDIALTPPKWLVKNLIEADSFGEIFGEPGCGKSFLAIELACCVATGTPFYGRAVKKPGPVYYLAAEGRSGLVRRFTAWKLSRGISLKDAPLYLNDTPLQLIDGVSAPRAAAALRRKEEELRAPPSLIILDTWSRVLGGDDSSPQDASEGVAALDELRSRFDQVAAIVIHHSGQNMRERSRGWSGLRAAVDLEFRMDKGKDGLVRLTCTKNKEGDMPEPQAFEIHGVDLKVRNEDGEPVYSAVLDEVDYVEDPGSGREDKGAGGNQKKALEILRILVRENSPVPVTFKTWRARCTEEGIERVRFYEAKNGLVRRGLIQITGEFVFEGAQK
jgi:hypothetical protein